MARQRVKFDELTQTQFSAGMLSVIEKEQSIEIKNAMISFVIFRYLDRVYGNVSNNYLTADCPASQAHVTVKCSCLSTVCMYKMNSVTLVKFQFGFITQYTTQSFQG